MNRVVRNCTMDDLDYIKQLALDAWLNAYRGIYPPEVIHAENEKFYTKDFHHKLIDRTHEGKHLFKILEVDGKVSGLMDFDFDEDRTWLMRFYIQPTLIGIGMGSYLMNSSENDLQRMGRTEYFLLVHARNPIGLSFYERNGFERFPRYDQENDEELCFKRKIMCA